jgi:cell division inhibitor SepF
MSTLHRLKAYFGMVPADEFDAALLDDPRPFDDAASFDAAEFDGCHSAHHSSYSGSTRPDHRRPPRVAAHSYHDSFPAHAGHHAVPGAHDPRSSSAPMDPLGGRSSRVAAHWNADAPVRGSLAIDTATTNPARIKTAPPTRQPIVPQPAVPESRADLRVDDEGYPLSRIVTLHPHSYNEARPIGERYREGNPVIMNLTAMEDRDAKRLVDFAAGLAFALRGSIDKVTNKVFLLSPPNIEVSAADRRRIAEGRLFT